ASGAPASLSAGIRVIEGHRRGSDLEHRFRESPSRSGVTGPGATDGVEDLSGHQNAEIALRLLQTEALGMLIARPSHSPGHSYVMKSGDDTFVVAFVLCEMAKLGPHAARTVESALHCLRLLMVGGEIESNPAGDVLI